MSQDVKKADQTLNRNRNALMCKAYACGVVASFLLVAAVIVKPPFEEIKKIVDVTTMIDPEDIKYWRGGLRMGCIVAAWGAVTDGRKARKIARFGAPTNG